MRRLLAAFGHAGFTVEILVKAAWFSFRRPRPKMLMTLMYEGGLKSLLVVAIVALFSGMILTLQTGIQLVRLGQDDLIGALVAQTFSREFGPFVTCIILVGTIVSAYTAEIGTMKVSEEVSALEVLSIDPMDYLAAPRIVALAVMTFMLTACADFVGILGGGLVASFQLGVPFERYLESALETLRGGEWFGLPKDVYAGLVKAGFTGGVIAAIGCAQGLTAQGGALGVGRAVRRAVINSIVLILVISYDFTWLVYRAFLPT